VDLVTNVKGDVVREPERAAAGCLGDHNLIGT
jgi:hypothetical protein